MQTRREMTLTLAALAAGIPVLRASAVLADPGPPNGRPDEFSSNEMVANGHRFFGSVSRGLAEIVEAATKRWGKPNGYVLGQEAGGAFIGGLRYGEGIMYTRNAGDLKVFWQGPSLGFDAGADGSAYLVGGFGMTALVNDNVFVVPIRSGLGARLGFNVSYLKFTESSTW